MMTVNTREIAGSLRVFTAERAPIGVTLGLALGLCAGPWAMAGGDGAALLRSVAVVFLVLVVLRIADDVRSLDHDRISSPERALPAGRISMRPLVAGAAVLFAAALLLSVPRLSLALGLLALYYAGYYALAERIPVVVRPVLVNAVFLAIPASVGLMGGDVRRHGLAMLGLFFWLSAVGHDYAHAVHAAGESPAGVQTCSQVVGPRLTAGVGLACYAGGCAAGLLAVRGAPALGGGDWPLLFLVGLTALFAHVAYLLVRLIAHPSRARARRLYVSGFACFAIPSLLLGLDRLLGR
jgi:4-hydroxybenzoate polyprenyltransferase